MKSAEPAGALQAFKAEFFKALAHPIRIRILEILVRGERGVHELQEALGLDQPTVSQHLAVLRAKNIVEAAQGGRHRPLHGAGRRRGRAARRRPRASSIAT